MISTETLTEDQILHFETEGFLILPHVVPSEHLALLREVCNELTAGGNAVIDGGDIKRNHKFLFNCMAQKPALREFVFSSLYARITRALLGPDVWFINDQYSCKEANTGGVFPWHQDGAYIGGPHRTYLTTWVALTDMSEDNGTVRVVPRSQAKVKEVVAGANSLLEGFEKYIGDETGIPVVVPAGSMALFDSTIFHTSTANHTPLSRNAYVVQFAAEAQVGVPDYGMCIQGEVFLREGEVVSA